MKDHITITNIMSLFKDKGPISYYHNHNLRLVDMMDANVLVELNRLILGIKFKSWVSREIEYDITHLVLPLPFPGI